MAQSIGSHRRKALWQCMARLALPKHTSCTGADAQTLCVFWLPVSICFSPQPYRANGCLFSFILIADLWGLLVVFLLPLANKALGCCRGSGPVGTLSVSLVPVCCSGFPSMSFLGGAFEKRNETRWKHFKSSLYIIT